jgi:alginate O-acetyltransferase complex protein AlgI
MSFDTVTFWIFFAVAFLAWRLLPFPLAKGSALLASLFFYGWWNPWYLILIAASAGADYLAGARIDAARDRAGKRRWLAFSLCFNLGLLAVFKYAAFAVENFALLGRALGHPTHLALPDWVIPVGISFYTFQTLSYSLDIYRGNLAPCRSFLDFFLFVSFYPQLVAGPIVRARELLPQLARRRSLSLPAIQTGLYYCVSGLFLKVVIADNLAPAVERAFASATLPGLAPLSAWLGVLYFAVQIFADFAGYSGIAIGLAYLLGLRFPRNFRYPYISRGLSEFWTRWHISLSQWLRDYLYISLGGNRHGPRRTYLALLLTMLLGGLWHGASWTFVAWGGLHGVGLCVERLLRGDRRHKGPATRPSGTGDLVGRLVAMAVVFVFVLTTWVFFRAENFAVAWQYLERMYVAPFREPFGFGDPVQARFLVLVAPVFVLHLGQLAHEWYAVRKSAWSRAVVAALMLLALTVVRGGGAQPFIYFQF